MELIKKKVIYLEKVLAKVSTSYVNVVFFVNERLQVNTFKRIAACSSIS